jgi:hypothetical protein
MNQPKPLIPKTARNRVPPAVPVVTAKNPHVEPTLKDQIALLLANNADSVEKAGEAISVYSAKYDGVLKIVMFAVGYAVKLAGRQIDKKIMRARDIKK